jgi:hypothetical protein
MILDFVHMRDHCAIFSEDLVRVCRTYVLAALEGKWQSLVSVEHPDVRTSCRLLFC